MRREHKIICCGAVRIRRPLSHPPPLPSSSSDAAAVAYASPPLATAAPVSSLPTTAAPSHPRRRHTRGTVLHVLELLGKLVGSSGGKHGAPGERDNNKRI